jgi:hypothetical protein
MNRRQEIRNDIQDVVNEDTFAQPFLTASLFFVMQRLVAQVSFGISWLKTLLAVVLFIAIAHIRLNWEKYEEDVQKAAEGAVEKAESEE